MKKLFLLIPALFIAMMMNAKVIEIGSGTSNILYSTIAASSTENGDVIILTDAGPYVNAYGEDDYTKLKKNLTIKAAPSVQPVIKFEVPFRISDAASVKFIGIKFDGSDLEPNVGYNYYFRVNSNEDNCLEFKDCEFTGTDRYMIYVHDGYKAKSLKFENCEFYGNTNYIITGSASSHVGACEINNCYFHDNTWNPIYFVASSVENQQTCSDLKVTNSTFANIDCSSEYRSVIDIKPYGDEITDAIKVVVDHCTFYNNSTINSDHSAIRPYKLSDVTISNCIFAHAESYARRATCCWGGTVSNCLTYNLTKDESKNGHGKYGGDMTLTNNFTADPLFNDLENNKYTVAGNWTTMNLSPARGAAADGSDLGDPRWYSAEVLPEIDFASPYQFVGAKAQIAGNIWYNSDDAYLYYNDKSECGTATWKIHATRACILNATLNMNAGTTTGHQFKVEILDKDGNKIGETAEPSSKSDAGNIALPDNISIPAAGDYTIKLYNLTGWSSAKIDGVTFTYVGGAVQAMPGTTDINDAWFSSNGTRADGKITIPSGYQHEGWVKWNVSFANAGNYEVKVNIDNSNGHNYTVALYRSESDESPITVSEGAQKSTIGTLELGAMVVPAGNYILKVTNATQYSDAKLVSVNFTYAGGAVILVPDQVLVGHEAVLRKTAEGTLKVSKLANGDLKYGDNGSPLGEYVYWNIHATQAGNMKVTLNVVAPTEGSASSHYFKVELYTDLNESPISSSAETDTTSATGAIKLAEDIIIPAEGYYIIKLVNHKKWSSAILRSIEFDYVGGIVQVFPCTCTTLPIDALRSNLAFVNANGEMQFTDESDSQLSHVTEQWIKWITRYTLRGCYSFDIRVKSENCQSYEVTIWNSDETELLGSATLPESGNCGYERVIHIDNIYLENEEDYVVKIQNTTNHSKGRVIDLVATYERGARRNVPGQILGEDAMIRKEESSTHDIKMYHLENGDLQYNDNGHNLEEYALWNIHVTEACEAEISFNSPSGGHQFRFELYQSESLIGSIEESEANWLHNVTLTDHLTFPAIGDYTLKLINKQAYSSAVLHSVTFTKYIPAAVVAMSDTDENIDAWSAYVGGEAVNVQLNRTISGGMYNAICLPFALTGSQVKAAFGNDVELYYLDDASLDGEVLNLQFATANDIYQGTPYLIKTSSDVVDPTFNGVSIVLEEASSTYHNEWPVSFKGSFVAQSISGSDNLLLYANDKVGFSTSGTNLKGFRAYFHLTSPSLAPSIKRARIVAPHNTPTDIELVGTESSLNTQKVLRDAQLIIIKNGVQYNAQGQIIK